MRTPQEVREIILGLLAKMGSNTHRMLMACGYNPSLVNDLKKGQMPSADKLATIAKFLGVSSEFLLGMPEGRGGGAGDADLIEELRREFYGSPAIEFTPEDKRAIIEMARHLRRALARAPD